MSRVPDLSDLDLQLEDVEDYTSEYPTVEDDIRTTYATDEQKQRRGVLTSLVLANKKLVLIAGSAFVILIAIIAHASSGSEEVMVDDSHVPLILVDPSTLDPAVTEPLMANLLDQFVRHGIDKSSLDPSAGDDTPQRRAFFWAAHDYSADRDHTSQMARYALAVFYYSTNGIPSKYEENPFTWFSADKWLTKEHACEWQGIECNQNLHVTTIEMERNNLSGKLPVELLILKQKLATIDLSSNLMHMKEDDYDAFKELKNLETLLMDDNFLEGASGLPTQMAQLTNLEKLRLSYNLFEGQLEADENSPVIGAMSKLTHLELESCFLSGTMPEYIGTMDKLVYLYMRRNDMTFNLDFLKTGEMSNIFAIWLDANEITGTIPTEVGLLTSLASFSLTNATITGTIPTQMADMSSLRRLWLFNNELTGSIPKQLKELTDLEVLEVHHNKLTGDMPNGLCNVIEKSEYEFKSLTSDCDSQVECSNSCCTKCF